MDHDCPQKRSDLGPTSEAQSLPCTSCTTICVSVHGPVSQECHTRGCYICADFARVNDEIANTYKRLSDLVAERQKLMKKTGHDTLIHCMPVEIISSIFFFVRDMALDLETEEHPDHTLPSPRLQQPSISPPLLVGAVCRRWRDISLTTSQLWTVLAVNLTKPVEGQYNMVKEWARRSGTLPLDITIYPNEDCHNQNLLILLSTLRSLAPRWNDLALSVPPFVRHGLLDSLEDTPFINSLTLFGLNFGSEKTNLPHPLCPRRLICDSIFLSREVLPFQWHRLAFLRMGTVSVMDVLYIIQRAENLRHCIVGNVYGDGTDNPVTHHGLNSFDIAAGRMIQHLTLPSLQHLDYGSDAVYSLHEIVEFLDRSRAPLNVFAFRCSIFVEDPFPPLERLYGVTSLFLEPDNYHDRSPELAKIDDFLALLLLPSPPESLSRLKKITFELPGLTASSWSLLGRLFREDSNPSDIDTLVLPNDYSPTRKAKSGACIPLSDAIKSAMKTRPILRLLEVKHSGVDIVIASSDGSDSLIL